MSEQPEDIRCPFPGCVVPLPHSHGVEVDAALSRAQVDTPSTRAALERLNTLQPNDRDAGRTFARGGYVEAPQEPPAQQRQSPDYVISDPEILERLTMAQSISTGPPEDPRTVTYTSDTPTSREVLHACSGCGIIYKTMDEANACYLSHPQCGHPSENGPETCEEPFGHAGPHGYTRKAPTVNVEPLSSLSDRLVMAETISTGPVDDPRSIVIRAQPTAEETVEIMARDLYEITQSGMAQDYPWASRPKRQQEDYRNGAREFMKRGWSRS